MLIAGTSAINTSAVSCELTFVVDGLPPRTDWDYGSTQLYIIFMT